MEFLSTLSVSQVLERAAALAPEKVAVVDGDRRKTYIELDEMATTLAMNLSEFGFRKGDRVSIYMKNSIELIIAFYGLQKLGVIVAWINPTYRRSEAEFILKNSESRAVFIFREWEGHDYLASILDVKKTLPGLSTIVVVGNGEGQGVQFLMNSSKENRVKTFLLILWILKAIFPC
jgi:cyclohexanecarboxylate-CoA ligase